MTHSFDTLKRPADGLKRRALMCICLGMAAIGAAPLSAQTAENRSAQASRSQIEAALAEAEKIVASPGYSGRVRGAKQREISLLKSRLTAHPGQAVARAGDIWLVGGFLSCPDKTGVRG